jgi:hypothetical protein
MVQWPRCLNGSGGANVQVVLSAGQALLIDNHFRVVLGLRRTTLSDVHAVQPRPPHHRPGRYHWTRLSRAGARSIRHVVAPFGGRFIAPCLPSKTEPPTLIRGENRGDRELLRIGGWCQNARVEIPKASGGTRPLGISTHRA